MARPFRVWLAQDAPLATRPTELRFLPADGCCPPSDGACDSRIAKPLLDGLSAAYPLVRSSWQLLAELRPFKALALPNLPFSTDALMLSAARAVRATGGIRLCDGSVLLRR